jgi:GT2 family glycosyltransferase
VTDKTIVIVLNFNGTTDTLACLETLVPQRHDALSVLVVDNASSDDPGVAINHRFPDVPVLRLAENRGWAGGNNAGIEWALGHGADFICLLNNDTLIPPGGIDTLAAAARAIGPCLLHPSIDFADPAEGAQLNPQDWPNSVPIAGHEGVFELTYAYGACLMIPADLFRQIGLFDERFFLQLEETDFFLRAQRIGLRSLCLPAVRIIHAESRSFNGRKTPLKTYYIVRNSLLLAEKHDRSPAGYVRTLRRILWSMAWTNSAGGRGTESTASVVAWLLSRDPFAVYARQGIRDYLFRRFGRFSRGTHNHRDGSIVR